MTFLDLYPDFLTFKNRLNSITECVSDSDEYFYNYFSKLFSNRNFLSDDKNYIDASFFAKWKILKNKWVKLLAINEKEVNELVTQSSSSEVFQGNLTEIGSETKKFLANGGSNSFKPAFIDRIVNFINLPEIFDELKMLFQDLFFNLKTKNIVNVKNDIQTGDVKTENPQREGYNNPLTARAALESIVDKINKGGGGAENTEQLQAVDAVSEGGNNQKEINERNVNLTQNLSQTGTLDDDFVNVPSKAKPLNEVLNNVEQNVADNENNIVGHTQQINNLGNRVISVENKNNEQDTLIQTNTNKNNQQDTLIQTNTNDIQTNTNDIQTNTNKNTQQDTLIQTNTNKNNQQDTLIQTNTNEISKLQPFRNLTFFDYVPFEIRMSNFSPDPNGEAATQTRFAIRNVSIRFDRGGEIGFTVKFDIYLKYPFLLLPRTHVLFLWSIFSFPAHPDDWDKERFACEGVFDSESLLGNTNYLSLSYRTGKQIGNKFYHHIFCSDKITSVAKLNSLLRTTNDNVTVLAHIKLHHPKELPWN